jgi:hypothetical protein
MPKVVELTLSIDLVAPLEAVLPSEAYGPTVFEITPVCEDRADDTGALVREISFRVAFEPDNQNRRVQPYRQTIAPVFPNGWKLGDPWPSPE